MCVGVQGENLGDHDSFLAERRRSELGSSCGGEEKEHMNGAPAGVSQGLGDEPCGVKAGSVFCCGAEWVGFPAQRWGVFEEEERVGQRFSLFF